MPTINPVNASAGSPAAEILGAIKSKIGMVPNIYATMAHSPALLHAYLGYGEGLGQGVLGAALAEQIALTVAGENGCDYCASAHSALARGAGVASDEATRNLRGEASDPRTAVILDFVRKVVKNRGHVEAADLQALRNREVSDAELVEIIAHVGMNLFTNYFNHIVDTDIDFPVVRTDPQSRAA
ncbi:carboxymuconolactone decarboxylase family protein [Elongatibacter sediminis]|uniref:Carboxymuconolactone decarboxylase family protein n=1 Tax=Elongatibacter sediminis TaxID=3119006 RepID=A0AAW9RGI7_9GAMM